MGYVTNSLARQSAIANLNNAQAAIIRGNEAQQGLLNSSMSPDSIAKKENQIETDRIKAETQAKVAKAQKDALDKDKNRKLNLMA